MFLVITSRLQLALAKIETPLQFGDYPKICCPEVSFSLCSLLQIRKEHELCTGVGFADLTMPYTSINYKLLFVLL